LELIEKLCLLDREYKIIASTCFSFCDNNEKQVIVSISIHTLGTDYWRNVKEDFPCHYYYFFNQPGVFSNENVNWLATAYDDPSLHVIVSFNLKKETYQKSFHCKQFGTKLTLGVLGDCLCIVSDDNHNFFDVWIMEEYGNEKSWTKLLKIPHTTDYGSYCSSTKVLYVSKDGQVLMECRSMKTQKVSLAVYNSVNKTFKISKIQNNISGHIILSRVDVESLILSSFF
jgi:F-box interacting protein